MDHAHYPLSSLVLYCMIIIKIWYASQGVVKSCFLIKFSTFHIERCTWYLQHRHGSTKTLNIPVVLVSG